MKARIWKDQRPAFELCCTTCGRIRGRWCVDLPDVGAGGLVQHCDSWAVAVQRFELYRRTRSGMTMFD